MKPKIYVETSIPSFYHEVRLQPDMVARREWTRQWWADALQDCELVTSPAVIEELERICLAGKLDLPNIGISMAA